jgi:hypothetical protein
MMQQTAGAPAPVETSDPSVDVSRPETSEAAERNDPSESVDVDGTALYAATNLDSWETEKPRHFARDVGIDGVCYRRLDPEYYAWLRHKMALAKKALESGRLDPAAFDGLRTRFNAIHAWAVERFGEDELLAAVRSLDPKTYPPLSIDPAAQSRPVSTAPVAPVAYHPARVIEQYLYPKDGEWRFTEKVPQSAVDKVDAIRDQAISLGWSETRLYQNRGRFRFPCGEDYGLVCFVDAKERIGDVTRQYIEIIGPPPRENRLRFHNPDVDQPWLKRTNPET